MDPPAEDTRGISAHIELIRINKQFGAAKAGIFEPVDLSDVPTKEFIEGAVTKYGVGLIYYSYMISYNTNKWQAGKGPASMQDIWDVKKFPGPRSMKLTAVSNLEAVLLADGVPRNIHRHPFCLYRKF
jgi:putative spermidine/putrescine transport system substrate-binding protein